MEEKKDEEVQAITPAEPASQPDPQPASQPTPRPSPQPACQPAYAFAATPDFGPAANRKGGKAMLVWALVVGIIAIAVLAVILFLNIPLLLPVAFVLGLVGLLLSILGLCRHKGGPLGGFSLGTNIFIVTFGLMLSLVAAVFVPMVQELTYYANYPLTQPLSASGHVSYSQLKSADCGDVVISGYVVDASTNDAGESAFLMEMGGMEDQLVIVKVDNADGLDPVSGEWVVVKGADQGNQSFQLAGEDQTAPVVDATEILGLSNQLSW